MKKDTSPFVHIRKSKKYPKGWVMTYNVGNFRRIVAAYAHDKDTVDGMIMTRKDALLMAKAITKALKIKRKPSNGRK